MSKYCNQYYSLRYDKIEEIMESPKQQIISNLQKAIEDLTGLEVTPRLEHPMEEKHGDYSSNIAMTIFSKFQIPNSKFQIKPKSKVSKLKTPLELAREIAKTLNSQVSTLNLERVEAVKPGFINFWLSKNYLTTLMIYIIRVKEEYGNSKRLENKKIMVEFTDTNPFKEFHIGHLYSNIVGESICRLLEANGAIVKRANYQGDVGMHVAKALYGLLQISNLKSQISNLTKKSFVDKAKFLGEAYAFGARAYDESEKAKKEIEKINKQIYEENPAIMALYKKGREWSLKYFESIYKRLGTKFDFYYFEREVGKYGLKLVKEYLGKGVFKESIGAIIFPGEKYKLHNRVFINSQGFPTYEAKELGLAPTKYKDFKYDESIIVTGNEIIEYFKVLLTALKQIYPSLAAATKHVAHGIVRLTRGKMSSRTGSVILAEWLLDEIKRRIITKYKKIDQNTTEEVAVGAVKYALLKSSIGRDIAFDFDESISLEGNSGPYLQYTYARTQSVVRKSKIQNSKSETNSNNQNTKFKNYKLEPEEALLLRAVYRFPEIVEEAAERFAPNLLCNFLFDLCQKFNLFYQKVPILRPVISADSQSIGVIERHPRGVIETQKFRIALTMVVGEILKNGLYLLGIQVPKRM